MIRPSEAQALYCLFVKKLWDEHSLIEPVLMLLGQILAYIPRPVLTLNCPMEHIILDIEREPDFIFARCGLVYGIFVECDAINIRTLHPLGEAKTLAKTSEKRATFYYNADISHLYALYDNDCPTLLDYDVKANKVNEVYKIPLLSKLGVWPVKMTVVMDEVFLVVNWSESVEVFHTTLARLDELAGICSICLKVPHDRVYHLTATFGEPTTVKIMYCESRRFKVTTLTKWSSALPFTVTTREVDFVTWQLQPIVGSSFCRYGWEDAFVLWNCTSGDPPSQGDLGTLETSDDMFDNLAAADATGKAYFIAQRRYSAPRGLGRTYMPIRLVKAHTYIRNIVESTDPYWSRYLVHAWC